MAIKRAETTFSPETRAKHRKYLNIIQVVNLGIWMLFEILASAGGWRFGTIEHESGDIDVSLSNLKIDGETLGYGYFFEAEKPYSTIAKLSYVWMYVQGINISICFGLGILSIFFKFRPYKVLHTVIELIFWTAQLFIYSMMWVTVENSMFLKVEYFPQRREKEDVLMNPLFMYFSVLTFPSVSFAIFYHWMMLRLTEADRDPTRNPQNSTLTDNKSPDEVAVLNQNASGEAPKKEESSIFEAVKVPALTPDFAIDAYSLFFLSTTKAFKRRIRTRVGAYLVRASCLVVCFAQMYAMFSFVTGRGNFSSMNGNEDHLELRLVLIVIIFFLLMGDILLATQRASLPLLLPSSCFKKSKFKWMGIVNRLFAGGLFLGQLFVSIFLLPELAMALMRIEDSEGVPGILSDFTAYVVLIEIDNLAVSGILAVANRFDDTVTQASIQVVQEDFFEDIEIFNTPLRKRYLKIIANTFAIAISFFAVVLTYPVLIYRFLTKAYVLWECLEKPPNYDPLECPEE